MFSDRLPNKIFVVSDAYNRETLQIFWNKINVLDDNAIKTTSYSNRQDENRSKQVRILKTGFLNQF